PARSRPAGSDPRALLAVDQRVAHLAARGPAPQARTAGAAARGAARVDAAHGGSGPERGAGTRPRAARPDGRRAGPGRADGFGPTSRGAADVLQRAVPAFADEGEVPAL